MNNAKEAKYSDRKKEAFKYRKRDEHNEAKYDSIQRVIGR